MGSSPTSSPREGLDLFGVDILGLDKVDRSILDTLCRRFGGHPVGLTTLAQCVGEETDTIEDAYEPFLSNKASSSVPPAGESRLRGRSPTLVLRSAGSGRARHPGAGRMERSTRRDRLSSRRIRHGIGACQDTGCPESLVWPGLRFPLVSCSEAPGRAQPTKCPVLPPSLHNRRHVEDHDATSTAGSYVFLHRRSGHLLRHLPLFHEAPPEGRSAQRDTLSLSSPVTRCSRVPASSGPSSTSRATA